MRYTKKRIDYRNRIVALDIEATGFGVTSDVVQFSMINENRKQIFNIYTCPLSFPKAYLKELLKESCKVNHITYSKIAGHKPLFFYKDSIQKYLNNADVIVGFSIHHDIRWLNKNGIHIANNKTIIDVQHLFMVYRYLQQNQQEWYRVYSLAKCSEYCGFCPVLSNVPLHNSLGDAEATLFCYEYLKSRQVDLSVGRTDSSGKPLMCKAYIDDNIEVLKRYSKVLKDFSCVENLDCTATALQDNEVTTSFTAIE